MSNIKKVIISGDDFDKLYGAFEKIKFRADTYVPTKAELKGMVQDLETYAVFLMWLDDTGEVTEENEEMHTIISSIVKDYIIIGD